MPRSARAYAVRRTTLLDVRDRALASAAFVLCVASAAWPQQSTSSPAPPDAPSAARNQNAGARQGPLMRALARRSLFFPDIAATPGPLSTGQKFQLFVNDSISPSVLAESTLSSAITQATNSPEGWGQGWDAYGKRFGASMARRASSEFFGTFMLASMLGQDPRFFPEENPTFSSSVKYSFQRLVVTRDDAGHDVANWSGLLGPLMGEGLANAYWPENERTVGDTFERYGFDLAGRVGTNILRNYWPVFFKKLRRSPHQKASN